MTRSSSIICTVALAVLVGTLGLAETPAPQRTDAPRKESFAYVINGIPHRRSGDGRIGKVKVAGRLADATLIPVKSYEGGPLAPEDALLAFLHPQSGATFAKWSKMLEENPDALAGVYLADLAQEQIDGHKVWIARNVLPTQPK